MVTGARRRGLVEAGGGVVPAALRSKIVAGRQEFDAHWPPAQIRCSQLQAVSTAASSTCGRAFFVRPSVRHPSNVAIHSPPSHQHPTHSHALRTPATATTPAASVARRHSTRSEASCPPGCGSPARALRPSSYVSPLHHRRTATNKSGQGRAALVALRRSGGGAGALGRGYYKGGFEPKMTRREAALILEMPYVGPIKQNTHWLTR